MARGAPGWIPGARPLLINRALCCAQPAARRWEVDCPINMENVHSLEQLQGAVEGANAAGQLVVVQFFASDCYACKSMQPKMRQIARDNGDVKFCKLNGAASEELRRYCEDMSIDRIPYFPLYADGRRVAHFSANMRPEKLTQLRSAIAQHKHAAAAVTPAAPAQATAA
jgi:thioredoxin-like negative regulator of GroEL